MLPFDRDADNVCAQHLWGIRNMVGPIAIITDGWLDCTTNTWREAKAVRILQKTLLMAGHFVD